MAEHWWRAYDGSIDHPKLLKLSDAMHRAWFTLQCVASANGGVLPPASDIALRLRVKPSKVAEWITNLVASGLLDRDGQTYRPHNWNERQYRTDTADPTAASRAKRYRDRKRDDRDATVTHKRPDTDTDTDTDKDAVADDARAKPSSGNLTTPEALQLAEKLLVIAGHDPSFWPPGWCGAPMRVQTWLDQGWPAEIIVAATQSSAKRKRGAPASSVQFFEKSIAEEVARQAAPLPSVEIRQAEKLTVTKNGPHREVSAACDSLIDRLNAGFGGAAPQEPPGGGAHEIDARLLAYGRG